MRAVADGQDEAMTDLLAIVKPLLRRYEPRRWADREDLEQTVAMAFWKALKEHPPKVLNRPTC